MEPGWSRKGCSPLLPFDELKQSHACRVSGQGVGLAAPQIAVPLRLFVIEDTEERTSKLGLEHR